MTPLSRAAVVSTITAAVALADLANLSAEPATPGATIEFDGTCTHIHNDQNKLCDRTLINLRFVDGFDSFQFREGDQVTAFVGRRWKDNSGPNSMLPNNILFMPLQQISFYNKATGKASTVDRRGQCVLSFKTPTTHGAQDVTKIWCEYSANDSNTDGHAFWMSNLSEPVINTIGDQTEAAVKGYRYYR